MEITPWQIRVNCWKRKLMRNFFKTHEVRPLECQNEEHWKFSPQKQLKNYFKKSKSTILGLWKNAKEIYQFERCLFKKNYQTFISITGSVVICPGQFPSSFWALWASSSTKLEQTVRRSSSAAEKPSLIWRGVRENHISRHVAKNNNNFHGKKMRKFNIAAAWGLNIG